MRAITSKYANHAKAELIRKKVMGANINLVALIAIGLGASAHAQTVTQSINFTAR